MKTEKFLSKATDEEVLTEFVKYLSRVDIEAELIQGNNGLFTHDRITARCGDRFVVSEAKPFPWPLQLMPMPESLLGRVN